MTTKERACGVSDYFLHHGWVKEEDRKAVSEGIELAIIAATVDVNRLREAIWPGLPKWTPTAECPKQDFYEAVAESLRDLMPENKRLRDVIAGMRSALRQAKDGLVDAAKIGGYGEKCVAGPAFNACVQGLAVAESVEEHANEV